MKLKGRGCGEAERWQRKEAGPGQSEKLGQPQVWGTLVRELLGSAGFMCAFVIILEFDAA